MLEVLGIILLCNKNKANAMARGRKPGGFVALTIVLWLGLEFIGALIGFLAEWEVGAYVLALLFAIIGGIISYLVAKNCRPGNYVAPAATMTGSIMQNAQPLAQTARIDIIRESSMVGAIVSWTFNLNGQEIGKTANGQYITAYTDKRQNILRATDGYGTEIAPFVFDVESGGFAQIHFKANRFIPENCRGILMPSWGAASPVSSTRQAPAPAVWAAPQPAAPPVSAVSSMPTADAGNAAFCHQCGTPISADMAFCMKCGAKRVIDPMMPMASDIPPLRESSLPPVMPAMADAPPAALNSVRAVWTAVAVFGAWVIFLLLQGAMGKGILFSASTAYLLTDMLLAAGAFLLMQIGWRYKLAGACVLVAETVMVTFNQTAVQVSNMQMGTLKGFFHYYNLAGLGYALIPAVIAAGLVLLFGYVLRKAPDKKRITGTGWIVAGGLLLYYIISLLVRYLPAVSNGLTPAAYLASSLINDCISAAMVALFIMLLTGICRQKKTRLRLSAWAIVWCALCGVALLGSTIALFAQRIVMPALPILLLAALAGYILLLCGRRIGFYIALIAISVYLTGTFQTSLQALLMGSHAYTATLISAIIGAANPVITWFSIREAWLSDGPAAYFVPPPPVWSMPKTVRTFPKVVTIINLVLSAALFIFPFPFIAMEGYQEGMTPCLVIGAAWATFSILAVVSLFGKKSVYHKWMDILMQVLFWIACAVVAGTLIVAAVNA